ncbi:MAG: hypothetical protein AMXMBFR23_24570 [Chloroflexota bacterium]
MSARVSRPSRARVARRAAALAIGALSAHLVRTVAFAQEATEVGGSVSTFGFGDWIGLLLRLGLVLGVIWGAVAAMRWYVRRSQGMGGRNGLATLEVIETHALGPNRALHLVRLGDRAVLVGATPERITSLLTVDDPEEVRRLSERPEATPRRSLAANLSGMSGFAASALRAPRASTAADDRDEAPHTTTAREAMTLGIASFRTMLPDLTLPLPRRRDDADPEGEAIDPRRPLTSRLRGMRERIRRPMPATPTIEESPSPRRTGGLFERTLAAAQVTGAADAAELDASRALRARSGYAAGPAAATSAEADRAQRIADVQAAIAAARRNAG